MRLILLLALTVCAPTIVAHATEPTSSVHQEFYKSDLPYAVLGSIAPGREPEFINLTRGFPVGPNSVFEIASMTKAITATAVLQQVEAGKIDLDEPIRTYLPEIQEVGILQEDGTVRPATRPITMRHLLTHTSGFVYFFNSPRVARDLGIRPGSDGWPGPERVPAGTYNWGFDIQPRRVFEAGERWQYGRGIGVAGRVVERVSGMNLDTYFKTHIFEPLGMTRSGYNVPRKVRAARVPMMTRIDGTGPFVYVPPWRAVPMRRFYGGGDLLSTPADYLRFLACLLNGGTANGHQVLRKESVDLFFTNQLPDGMTIQNGAAATRGPASPYRDFVDSRDLHSLGFSIEANPDERGNRPLGTGAWAGIFNTYFAVNRERGIAVVAFTNLMPFNDQYAYELYRDYEDEVFGRDPTRSHPSPK